jgi:hypothetical protein
VVNFIPIPYASFAPSLAAHSASASRLATGIASLLGLLRALPGAAESR